jgi:hypothetical protein
MFLFVISCNMLVKRGACLRLMLFILIGLFFTGCHPQPSTTATAKASNIKKINSLLIVFPVEEKGIYYKVDKIGEMYDGMEKYALSTLQSKNIKTSIARKTKETDATDVTDILTCTHASISYINNIPSSITWLFELQQKDNNQEGKFKPVYRFKLVSKYCQTPASEIDFTPIGACGEGIMREAIRNLKTSNLIN